MDEKAAVVTTIRVRPEIWLALRRLAELRAAQAGGRPSASGVIEALVEAEAARVEADRA